MSDVVLVFCLNPAIEISYHVPRFQPGLSTASTVSAVAGGKGTTVAKHLHGLGRRVILARPRVSASFDSLMVPSDRGFEVRLSTVSRPARFSIVVSSDDQDESSIVRHPGQPVEPDEAERLRDWACALVRAIRPTCVVMAGSLPPGALPRTYADIIECARSVTASSVLDAAGVPGRMALDAGPTIAKLNHAEAAEVLERPVTAESAEHASRLLAASAEIGIVTLGKHGAWATAGTAAAFCPAHPVASVCSAGAGDAFTAGVVDMLIAQRPVADMLERASRLGAWATTVPGSSSLPARRHDQGYTEV